MNFRNFLRTVAVACTFAVASTASATAILQVNSSGILTGATGVNVGGTLYDVTLADGTCVALFNNCVTSAFTFKSQAAATVAAQALLDQVFIDGPSGNFDSVTNKILGCTSTTNCLAFIPFVTTGTTFSVVYSANYSGSNTDSVSLTSVFSSQDTTQYNNANFAIFKLVAPAASAVPEPSSITLMALALAALAFVRRRKV